MNKPKWLELIYLAFFFAPPAIASGILLRILDIRGTIWGVFCIALTLLTTYTLWIAICVAYSKWMGRRGVETPDNKAVNRSTHSRGN